jgi:hypothetical protein
VQGKKKKHDKKDRRENNLGMRHILDHPIEPRMEFKNGLQRTLHVIEKRHERAERIHNCGRATMLVQDSKRFKALVVVQGPFVIEEEPKRTFTDSGLNLPLPEKTSLDIRRSRDQQRLIQELGAVLRLTEPVEDYVINIQVCFCILEGRKLDRLRRPERSHQGSNNQWRRRNRRRRLDTTRSQPSRRSRHMRRNWMRSQWDCRGDTAVRGKQHRQVRHGRGRDIAMGQRTVR